MTHTILYYYITILSHTIPYYITIILYSLEVNEPVALHTLSTCVSRVTCKQQPIPRLDFVCKPYEEQGVDS